jgi:putative signal transducing protein
MSDDLKLVYTGSRVESMFLEDLLKDNGIGVIRRDTLTASVQAGWANGSPEDAVRIFVDPHNFDKAKSILKEYFSSRDTD